MINNWRHSLLTLVAVESLVGTAEGLAFTPAFTVPPRRTITSSNLRTTTKQRISSTRTLYEAYPTCELETASPLEVPVDRFWLGQEFEPYDAAIETAGRTTLPPARSGRPTTKDINISLLPSEKDPKKCKSLPLVITPKQDRSLEFLIQFLEDNRDWVDRQMVHYGAVLLRGFDLGDDDDVDNNRAVNLEKAIQAYQPRLNNSYRGTSPRGIQKGTKFIFSAAEVPSHYPIGQHLEMSFLPTVPKQLFFSALRAPNTKKGGETALADFRKVYRDIPKSLREKLASKKIRYQRRHSKFGSKQGWFTRDVASMKGWTELFGSTSKPEVERIMKEEGTPMRWEQGKDGDDIYVSETVEDAFQLHPRTREPVWFNHAQVFHWTTFPAELFFAFRRTKDLRLLAHALFVSMFSLVKYGLLKQHMALEPSFGDDDGTPFSIIEMSQIRHAIHKNMVFNRWQTNDILMIDNLSTSHGRQPTYDSGRKVVVAWSDPLRKANEFDFQKEELKEKALQASNWE